MHWLIAECGWKRQPIIVHRCSVQSVSPKGAKLSCLVEQKLSHSRTCSQLFRVHMVFISYFVMIFWHFSAKGLQRAPRFIPSTSRFPWANLLTSKSSSSSPSPGAQSTFRAGEIGRPKRASYDDQCKGAYDREIFEKLDRLCEDCYNLYRKAYISYECRWGNGSLWLVYWSICWRRIKTKNCCCFI